MKKKMSSPFESGLVNALTNRMWKKWFYFTSEAKFVGRLFLSGSLFLGTPTIGTKHNAVRKPKTAIMGSQHKRPAWRETEAYSQKSASNARQGVNQSANDFNPACNLPRYHRAERNHPCKSPSSKLLTHRVNEHSKRSFCITKPGNYLWCYHGNRNRTGKGNIRKEGFQDLACFRS